MIKLLDKSDNDETRVAAFVVDSISEINELPTQTEKKSLGFCCAMGSYAFAIQSASLYMLNSAGLWQPILYGSEIKALAGKVNAADPDLESTSNPGYLDAKVKVNEDTGLYVYYDKVMDCIRIENTKFGKLFVNKEDSEILTEDPDEIKTTNVDGTLSTKMPVPDYLEEKISFNEDTGLSASWDAETRTLKFTNNNNGKVLINDEDAPEDIGYLQDKVDSEDGLVYTWDANGKKLVISNTNKGKVLVDENDDDPQYLINKVDSEDGLEFSVEDKKVKLTNSKAGLLNATPEDGLDNAATLIEKIEMEDGLEFKASEDKHKVVISNTNKGKVLVDENDKTPEYLIDKIVTIDGLKAEVEGEDVKLSNENKGKVLITDKDTQPGFLLEKVEADDGLEFSDNSGKLKLVNNNLGKVKVTEDDDVDYLGTKFKSKNAITVDVTDDGKIEIGNSEQGKVSIDSNDTADYLENKIGVSEELDIESKDGKVVISNPNNGKIFVQEKSTEIKYLNNAIKGTESISVDLDEENDEITISAIESGKVRASEGGEAGYLNEKITNGEGISAEYDEETDSIKLAIDQSVVGGNNKIRLTEEDDEADYLLSKIDFSDSGISATYDPTTKKAVVKLDPSEMLTYVMESFPLACATAALSQSNVNGGGNAAMIATALTFNSTFKIRPETTMTVYVTQGGLNTCRFGIYEYVTEEGEDPRLTQVGTTEEYNIGGYTGKVTFNMSSGFGEKLDPRKLYYFCIIGNPGYFRNSRFMGIDQTTISIGNVVRPCPGLKVDGNLNTFRPVNIINPVNNNCLFYCRVDY